MRLPPLLVKEWCGESAWLRALPALAADCAAQWQLELEEPIDTPHSLVVPAGEVVLKLNAPTHYEADHEPDALARWGGAGAVLVLERDDERRAFLCERCRPGLELRDAGVDALDVVGELLPRLSLHVDGPHPFRLVADEAGRWAREMPRRRELGGRPFELSLLETALDVFTSADRRAAFLVNQDLHGGNVLSAEREPWLVIDPKPLVGERELDAVGLLRDAAFTGHDAAVRRWLDALAGLGLDRERARGWGVAHALAWGWSETAGWDVGQIEVARTIASA